MLCYYLNWKYISGISKGVVNLSIYFIFYIYDEIFLKYSYYCIFMYLFFIYLFNN